MIPLVRAMSVARPAAMAVFAYWVSGVAAGTTVPERPPTPAGDYWHAQYWPGVGAMPKETN